MFSWSCLIYLRYSVGFISGGGAIQFVILLLVGIKQYVLTDVFAASLLLLELSRLRNIVLPYHLRMLLYVFMRR